MQEALCWGYPWLRATDMVKMLHKVNRLDLILPEKSLQRSREELTIYWQRFAKQYPEHDCFQILDSEALSLTLPIKLHGDEGRSSLAMHFFVSCRCCEFLRLSYVALICQTTGACRSASWFHLHIWGMKKSPLMLLSWQVVLGQGTSKSQKQPEEMQKDAQRLNLYLCSIAAQIVFGHPLKWFQAVSPAWYLYLYVWPVVGVNLLAQYLSGTTLLSAGLTLYPGWAMRCLGIIGACYLYRFAFAASWSHFVKNQKAMRLNKKQTKTQTKEQPQETTRWLLFGALKETYAGNSEALDEAMQLVAGDLSSALQPGIPLQIGEEEVFLRLCPVGVPKRGESQLFGHGVCHLCCGGMPGISYEDCSDSPDWAATMGSAAALCPWDSWSPWQDLPGLPSFRPWTFRPDIFHNFHLGHGRYFISSSLVILQEFEEGGGVDSRFEALTAKWRAFCQARKEPGLILFENLLNCFFGKPSSCYSLHISKGQKIVCRDVVFGRRHF